MTGAQHDPMQVDLQALAQSGTVHFMGVSGAGMSTLAELLARQGGRVTGCDLRPGAVGGLLRGLGITVHQGHAASHVDGAVALVITSAVPSTHPEVAVARERGIPVLKRAQALGAIVNRGTVLAVAGTHGKTTTTAAATAILDAADLEPTGLVGGRMPEWGGGLHAGSSDIYVVEADEYDRSFLTLRPSAALVTNVEADHLDIYGDIAAVESAFVEFLSQVREGGLIAVCGDDAGARRVGAAAAHAGTVLTYGTGANVTLRAVDITQSGRTMSFNVVEHGETLGSVTLPAPGMHNVRNALGAFALARHAGASFAAARTALRTFSGVSRRFQELGTVRGISIVDDYAHHPTEVAATVDAARSTYPERRLLVAFQPHLYTRTRDLASEFGHALSAADVVFVSDVYPARETPIPGVSGELVADAARSAGAAEVHYAPSLAELSATVRSGLRGGDVLVAMGAGDIDEMTHELFATLQREADA